MIKKHRDRELDEALEQLDVEQALDLTEIEEVALKLRHQVGQSTTEALAVNTSQQQAVDIYCPSCQARTRYKGRKKKMDQDPLWECSSEAAILLL